MYADDDPWIVRNSWLGRSFCWEETFCGTWLPLWYALHQRDFHKIAENLGKPGIPAWRRSDKSPRPPRERDEGLKTLLENRDVLHGPVSDEATFKRLYDLAPKCDAAVTTLLGSAWRPREGSLVAEGPAQLYVLIKFEAVELPDEPARRRAAETLARARSDLWAPEAWGIAFELDPDAYLSKAVENVSVFRVTQVQFLQSITGQRFGCDSTKWKEWLKASKDSATR